MTSDSAAALDQLRKEFDDANAARKSQSDEVQEAIQNLKNDINSRLDSQSIATDTTGIHTQENFKIYKTY